MSALESVRPAGDDLPARVRAARKSLKLTQQEVATAANVSLRAYQMFENRQSVPQNGNLRAILAAVAINEVEPTVGSDVAAETRGGWPADVRVFLDVMGAFLVTMGEDERLEFMRDMTRQIVASRRP